MFVRPWQYYYQRRPSLVETAVAGDATANGVVLTATSSLVAGAATADSTAAGTTLTATASLIAGAASASYTSAAQTLTATASLIAGSASADSTASGQTLTATASHAGFTKTEAGAKGDVAITPSVALTIALTMRVNAVRRLAAQLAPAAVPRFT